jgi:hypothetical protein
VPGATLPESGFPEGYPDEAAYLLDKCRMANLIVDGLVNTLRTLLAWDLVNAVGVAALLVLALFGVIVVPPVAIPIIVGALGVIAGSAGLLGQAADYISDNREDFVCGLYEADTAGVAIATLADLFDALISFIGTTTALGVALKTVLIVLVGPDTLNKLFSYVAGVGYPDADCSGCGPCGEEFLWSAGDEGWIGLVDGCFSFGSTAGASVVFGAPGADMDVPATSPVAGVSMSSGMLEFLLDAGSRIQMDFDTTFTVFFSLSILTDITGCFQANGGSRGPGSHNEDIDLSSLAGETVVRIDVYFNNSVGNDVDVHVERVALVC